MEKGRKITVCITTGHFTGSGETGCLTSRPCHNG